MTNKVEPWYNILQQAVIPWFGYAHVIKRWGHMRILLCDDQPEILQQVLDYVTEYFEGHSGPEPEFRAYTSGEELLENETYADMAFLDVEMKGISGIHVGAKLKEYNPQIKIFIITSFGDYLDEAMRYQVFRYLSKPIDKARLFRNLNDAVRQYFSETKEIVVTTSEGLTVISADNIVCVESQQRGVTILTTCGSLRSKNKMEFWSENLNLVSFFHTHRSCIVNMKYIVQIKKDIVLLKYGNEIKEAYLSRRKYNELIKAYLQYREGL